MTSLRQNVKKYWCEILVALLIFLMIEGILMSGAFKAGYKEAKIVYKIDGE